MTTSGSRIGGAADRPDGLQPFTGNPLPERPGDLVIGVIDTGVAVLADNPHPAIAGRLYHDWKNYEDVLQPLSDPRSRYNGHGTFVTGLILDEIRDETAHVNIAVRNVLDGPPEDNDRLVAKAIHELAAIDTLRIINMSFLGASEQESYEPWRIKRALRKLFEKKDVLVVTAAGNSWTNDLTWPAAFSRDFKRVIAVGALDDNVYRSAATPPPKASFSNYGPWVSAYARGARVCGPLVMPDRSDQSGWAWACGKWSGTSFAAATVTGLLAQAMISSSSHLDGWAAKKRVICGPLLPVAGLPRKHWRPYLESRRSQPGE